MSSLRNAQAPRVHLGSRGMPPCVLLMVVISLIVGSCSVSQPIQSSPRSDNSSTPAPTNDPWAALRRPLKIPALPSNGSCPRSMGHEVRTGDAVGSFLGKGPAFPALLVPGRAAYDGRLPARYDKGEQRHGWYGVKTLWVVKPSSAEAPILVRGGRLGGQGILRFAIEGWGELGDTESLSDGTLIGTEFRLENGDDSLTGWRHYPSRTLFRSAGCYAFQLDGPSFTQLIVFEVAPS